MKDLPTKEELEKKYKEFLQVRLNAINIVKKYIKVFKEEPGNELLLKGLERGLYVLEGGYKRIEREGIQGILKDLQDYPTAKDRPGLGLSRGFGDFLWQGEDWQHEILDAVDKIEDYYSEM